MVPWRATEEGEVTEAVLDWYGRFAKGTPGAIVVEATGIRDIPSGPLLRIGSPRYDAGLQSLVERVRAESGGKTRLFIQLIDFLPVKRRPEPTRYLTQFLAITPQHYMAYRELTGTEVPESPRHEKMRNALLELSHESLEHILGERELEALTYGYRERVTDLHLERIRDLPKFLPNAFSNAAKRAESLGFDGVELHYAHAYTMASFLSAQNTRADGYGGARENRIRLPLEVYKAVRKVTSESFVVGCRLLGDEIIEGGSRVSDAAYFSAAFANAGIDFISVSTGGKFEDAAKPKIGRAAYPYTGKSGYECMPSVRSDSRGPFGRNAFLAGTIRAHLRKMGSAVPIIAAGGINSFELAETILEKGRADIIGAARQSLADPDWFLKMKEGRGETIRRCQYTNYCEALDQMHKEVTCRLWDKQGGKEEGVKRTQDGKRRLTAP